MTHTKQHFALTLVVVAALSACAMTPKTNVMLDQARVDYKQAQESDRTAELAPAEMSQARASLGLANAAQERSAPINEINQLAYLAKQRVAIARDVSARKLAEEKVNNAQADRDKIRLTARTAEADMAHRRADMAQDSAARSATEAAAAQQMTADTQARNQDLEQQLKDLNAKQTARGLVITIADVLFDTNRSELKPSGWSQIDKLARFLTQYPNRRALVEGFTDSTGSNEHNLNLSQQRADAVRARLVEMGIASSRIQTKGYGETAPVASNDNQDGRQLNRRVEIVLSDESGTIAHR